MQIKKVAKIFGAVLVMAGLLGFIPGITQHTDASTITPLVTGLVAYGTSKSSRKAAKHFFQILGVLYAGIAIMNFFYGTEMNDYLPGDWFPIIVTAFSLFVGFLYNK